MGDPLFAGARHEASMVVSPAVSVGWPTASGAARAGPGTVADAPADRRPPCGVHGPSAQLRPPATDTATSAVPDGRTATVQVARLPFTQPRDCNDPFDTRTAPLRNFHPAFLASSSLNRSVSENASAPSWLDGTFSNHAVSALRSFAAMVTVAEPTAVPSWCAVSTTVSASSASASSTAEIVAVADVAPTMSVSGDADTL